MRGSPRRPSSASSFEVLLRLVEPGRALRAFLCVAAAGLVGCHSSDAELALGTGAEASLSFGEFLERTPRSPSGAFLVEGELPVLDEKHLREYYELAVASSPLVVARDDGQDSVWTAAAKRDLRYCVSSDFGADATRVSEALAQAARAWEAVADVRFLHQREHDAACDAAQTSVRFDVRPSAEVQGFAAAFFPNYPREQASLFVSADALSAEPSSTRFPNVTLAGILRHELGHVLGFRHEHSTRFTNILCLEPATGRAVTDYDVDSVMHYPYCHATVSGPGDWSFRLSARDAQGASLLYGAPLSSPPPEPPAVSRLLASRSGELLAGAEQALGPFDVRRGRSVLATLEGQGDPDLYLRFGAAPTRVRYDCRSYRSGADERCELDVPSGAEQVFVMVRGFRASTYRLRVAVR